ncbi:MAG TPA: isoamylase early set domain-containing protein [Gemmatimonadaceae bacterium]|nr:isoamylase early set domain-containing protein [Gemmatimonadaceae bacterium]
MIDHDARDMNDNEQDDAFVRGVADTLRAAEPARPDLTERVMHLVHFDVRRSRAVARGWWTRRRTIHISYSAITAVAATVVIAVAGAIVGRTLWRPPNAAQTVASATARTDTVRIVRFVLHAPSASSVALVGDFNDWQRGATPLRPAGAAGVWAVSLPLPPGLHQYAFIVDGTRWTPDPATSTTVTDDFGTTTSVIAVGDAT